MKRPKSKDRNLLTKPTESDSTLPGMIAGAIIGSMVTPVAGSIIGALLGGFFGSQVKKSDPEEKEK